jgi:hypothetical protein
MTIRTTKPESCQGPLVRGKNRFKEKQNRHLKDIEADEIRPSAKENDFRETVEPPCCDALMIRLRPTVYYAIAPQELPILEKEFDNRSLPPESAYPPTRGMKS